MSDDLHWLAESGQVERLREALAGGADADARDEEGRTALHVAVVSRQRAAAAALLGAGANADAAEEAAPSYRPLHRACLPGASDADGDPELVTLLLEKGADAAATDARGTTPLHLAVAWCAEELAASLLERGARADAADADGVTPLHVACRRGAPSWTEELLGDDGELAGPRLGMRVDTARGRLEDETVVRLLLAEGASAGAADARGVTPLHHAVAAGAPDAARILVEHGAAAAAADSWGTTPLHRAPTPAIAELLLDAGADADAADGEGRTPLHRAVGEGRGDVAALLLARGAHPGARDRDGRSPLHAAAGAGRAQLVERLLDAGADPGVRDADGRTPLELARAAGHGLVVNTLRRRGGGGRRGRFGLF